MLQQFNLINRFDFDGGESVAVRVTYQRGGLDYCPKLGEMAILEEGYRLWWSDCVANDWDEFYPDLSSCLARLAVLVACGENNFEPSFVQNGEEFRAVATDFFALTLS
jgi:hypothetical protein